MMKKYSRYIIIFLLVFISNKYPAEAQRKGKIEIIADVRIKELMNKNIEFNKKIKTVSGYRILIASLSGNSSKSSAFRIKDGFLSEYSDIGAYIIFEEPNFKVKVGDFRTRLEAFAFYQMIKNRYPCTIIRDDIYFSKITRGEIIEESEFEEDN